MQILYPLARRFIAGHDIKSMLTNIANYDLVTINYVGDSATTQEISKSNTKEYLNLIRRLKKLPQKQYEISVKLSQFGSTPVKWKGPMRQITRAVEQVSHITIKFDMEKEESIDDTLKFSRCFDDIGIVLQANMKRTSNDLIDVINRKRRVRICKGAYKGDMIRVISKN